MSGPLTTTCVSWHVCSNSNMYICNMIQNLYLRHIFICVENPPSGQRILSMPWALVTGPCESQSSILNTVHKVTAFAGGLCVLSYSLNSIIPDLSSHHIHCPGTAPHESLAHSLQLRFRTSLSSKPSRVFPLAFRDTEHAPYCYI